MKKINWLFLLTLLFSLVFVSGTLAQGETLTISLRRDFGYASGGGDIQGLFSISASGSANLAKVAFYVDETLIGEVAQTPFRLQFNTDNYALGQHQLYATATSVDGAQLKSQVVTVNFVSASDGWQAAMKIVIPIVSLALLAVLLSTVVPMLTGRKGSNFPVGVSLSYPLGGAICPKCERPFAIHIYGLNMLTHKFDRCPYCGRWSLVRRAPIEILRAAEQAQLARSSEQGQVPEMSPEEKLKKELDDSKYHEI